jgi:hypothetical protein
VNINKETDCCYSIRNDKCREDVSQYKRDVIVEKYSILMLTQLPDALPTKLRAIRRTWTELQKKHMILN